MLKTKLTPFHLQILTSNGAGFSIPLEVIKGIKDGSIDDEKYYQAAEFLTGEGLEMVTFKMIKDICEGVV